MPRARVGVSGAITPKITWYLQGDFANITNDGRVLRDAYLQFTATPQFAVRYGQLVAPFSLERLTCYTKLEVIDRSVIGTAMAPSRDVGLMVFNVAPWRGWITYGAAIINGTGQNRADDNNAKDVVGRVVTKVPRARASRARRQRAGRGPGRRRSAAGRRRPELRGARLPDRGRARVAAARIRHDRRHVGVQRHRRLQASCAAGDDALRRLRAGARYVDVDDDAIVLTSHQLQAGGTYFVTPALRVQSNVVLPIGDDQPRHAFRWWSRLQFNF